MKAVVIGGTGHVGSYLVPRLLALGYEVVCVSRGGHQPYQGNAVWKRVSMVSIDRAAEEKAGTFGDAIAALAPDVVVDMICFTAASGRQLAEALRGRVRHLVTAGTIWIHGPSVQVPTREEENRNPICDYGRNKKALEDYLLGEAWQNGLPVTLVHPGHIVGPGWNPVNPQGHLDPGVFGKLARGERLCLPNLGLETVHHVHADDVAGVMVAALANPAAAVGEGFHAVSPAALTLRGFAELAAAWFGRAADLAFARDDAWQQGLSATDVATTLDHISHSPNCSMDKARRLLGFTPRYSSGEAVYEAVQWLAVQGKVKTSLDA